MEDYTNVGESKTRKSVWLDYEMVNKIMRSLDSGYASEGSEKEASQRCINLDAQKQWTWLLRAKIIFH